MTYQAPVFEPLPNLPTYVNPTKLRSVVPPSKLGRWEVERYTVDPSSLAYLRHQLSNPGRRQVPPGEYTRLVRNGQTTVMSDTPAELRDLHWLSCQAQEGARTFLVNGMGLGLTLQLLLSYDHVRLIDVVELDPDVVRLVLDHVCPPEQAHRVRVHQADALTKKWPTGHRWDVAWHDIWDNICLDNLPDMVRLHRMYGRRVKAQRSWARELCQRGY